MQDTGAPAADVAGEERCRSFFRDFRVSPITTESGPVLFHGAVEAITGYTEDDFLKGAVCWDAVVHPTTAPVFWSAPANSGRSRPSTERVYRIVRKDGTTRWVRDFAKNVCNEDGTPALVQGTIHDAIGRREADDGLLSSNRQLSVLNKIMGVAASSLSLDELLEASLSVTIDLLDLDVGLTYLLNPERTLALTRYHHAAPKRYLARSRTIKVHHWPWNFVFVAGQPRYIERGGNPGAAEEEVLASLEVSTLACIPILAESVVVGALFLGRRDRRGSAMKNAALRGDRERDRLRRPPEHAPQTAGGGPPRDEPLPGRHDPRPQERRQRRKPLRDLSSSTNRGSRRRIRKETPGKYPEEHRHPPERLDDPPDSPGAARPQAGQP